MYYSRNSIGNVHEAFEDLNRLQEIAGISKFFLTFFLFYVYISRSSIQNFLLTLKKTDLRLCSTLYISKEINETILRKDCNKSIKSSGKNTG